MSRSSVRLAVFAVLIASLIATLLGRSVQLQAFGLDGTGAPGAPGTAGTAGTRTLAEPARRGLILDQAGRPLAVNRLTLQVVADRAALLELPRDGAAVLTAAAAQLGTSFGALDAKLTPCESDRAVGGRCWDGTDPFQIPLATDVPAEQAMPILEQPERFPGLAVRTIAVRSHPGGSGERAAHLIGHLGHPTQEELQGPDGGYRPGDLVGRGGLEEAYEEQLRGTPGVRTVAVDTTGKIRATVDGRPPIPGSTVISSIDARLQAVVERELAGAVSRAADPAGAALPADSGAAVVVDVTDGRVLALASYPDYSPTVFEGGISQPDYQALLDAQALLFRPVQGTYAPGSTFKPFTAAAMASAGFDLEGTYPCPSAVHLGGRTFTNYESHGYGPISLQRALEVSCNTVFYGAAESIWRSAGGQSAPADAPDPIHDTATAFGLGRATGVDLPGEAAGTVDGRAAKGQWWRANKDKWCAAGAEGYPQLRLTDPALADQYTALDQENCVAGGQWRIGDALNGAIGQGMTAITPLQLAMAYAAIANGGTIYRPRLAQATVAADGSTTEFPPVVSASTGTSPETLAFLVRSLSGVTSSGSAAAAFAGFPLDTIPVAGKTGSAQVPGGKAATAWFASFAPADEPRYAVVMMVTQGGTGGQTAAPSVRAIYDAIFGVSDGVADSARSVLVGGRPLAGLPDIGETADAPVDAPPPDTSGHPPGRGGAP